MAYRITTDTPGDEAFRVGTDEALEQELGRWRAGRRGDVYSGPMFSIKADKTGGYETYSFRGSDMDAHPLVR